MAFIVIVNGGGQSGGGGETVRITSASINESGQLVLGYSDGSSSNAGQVISDDQMDVLNNAFTAEDLGEGLSVDEDGKLVSTAGDIVVRVGDAEYPLSEGEIEIPIASDASPGMVKISGQFDYNDDGQLVITTVPVSTLTNDGTELIIGG